MLLVRNVHVDSRSPCTVKLPDAAGILFPTDHDQRPIRLRGCLEERLPVTQRPSRRDDVAVATHRTRHERHQRYRNKSDPLSRNTEKSGTRIALPRTKDLRSRNCSSKHWPKEGEKDTQ